jgi:hypothetical protein
MGRPLTQKEIKKDVRSKAEEPRTTVTNVTKRTIPLQLRDQNADFYVSERSVQIGAGKTFTDRTSLFNPSQLSNLQAKGEIRVLGGTI